NGDQSNSVAFFADQYVFKLFRRIEPETNPELEIGRALTARGFTHAPRIGAALEYWRPGLEPGTLAVVQQLVKNQGSCWDFTIDELRRYYERVDARLRRTQNPAVAVDPVPGLPAGAAPPAIGANDAPPPFFAALEQWYLASATNLGRRTAELHLALADAPGAAF